MVPIQEKLVQTALNLIVTYNYTWVNLETKYLKMYVLQNAANALSKCINSENGIQGQTFQKETMGLGIRLIIYRSKYLM